MKTHHHHSIVSCCRPSSAGWLFATVVVMTGLADWLFYRQPDGWPLGAFLLLTGLLLAVRPAAVGRRANMLKALAVLAVAAGAMAYRGGVLAPALTVLALGALVGARAEAPLRHAGEWGGAVLRAPLRAVVAVWHDQLLLLRRRRGAVRSRAAVLGRALAVWLLPLLLAGLFLWLFCLANPVIERGVVAGWNAGWAFVNWLELPAFSRVVFWLAVAGGLWGVWRARAWFEQHLEVPPLLAPARPLLAEETPAMAVRCLAVLNLLFAVETVTDLAYLWGGRALPEGMTYAAYAHRGAYPLLATALLSAAVTLCFFRPGRAVERHPVARALVLVWLTQNLLLTVSAVWRLHLYVEVFTLTRWRVAAFIWLALVGFGLLAIGWRIARHRDNRWLLDVNVAVLAAVLLAGAWWPVEGFIARHNVRCCQEAGGDGNALDFDYLRELGPDAIPALLEYGRLKAPRSVEATVTAEQLAGDLRHALRNPRAWTWRRAHLLRTEEEARRCGSN